MSNSGLYVHVPFCRSRCAYCDFYSQTDFSLAPAWIEALKQEAGIYTDRFGPFDSLYLGGGTPTALTGGQLTDLVGFLFKAFSFGKDLEFTLEANPDDLSQDCVARIKDLGVNRVSVGAQSLDDQELALLRRRHSASQVEKAVDRLRKAGFESLNMDLMYALPGQTMNTWRRTLHRALSLFPDHLSCYQLTIEKRTPLGIMVGRGKIRKAGVEDERRFFLDTSLLLEQEGFFHYEVSNFARHGHLCRHNLKYWDSTPYLGLGPSAHSFDGRSRWWNTRSIKHYLYRIAGGRPPTAGKETLSDAQRRMESLLLGFRTRMGVEIKAIGPLKGLDRLLEQLERSGLVVIREGRAAPTREGFLHADGLPLLFSQGND